MATYCSTQDVFRFMQLSRRYSGKTDFDTETVPTAVDVTAFIDQFEDHIDKETMHAWKEKTITESFDIDYEDPIDNYFGTYYMRVKLSNRKIKDLASGSGDSLQVWNGNEFEEWLDNKTEGRNRDYWLDYNQGVLFVKTYRTYSQLPIRVTYRYGETAVPGDIKEACVKLTSAEILQSDDRTVIQTKGTSTVSNNDKIDKWLKRAEFIINTNKEFKVI